MNLGLLLEMVAEGDPERIVIGSSNGGLSAGQLLESSRRAASVFTKSGAAYIGYFGLNSAALPVALFGAAQAGIPFAPINYRSTEEQLHHITGRLTPGLFVADPAEADRLSACGAEQVLTTEAFAQALDDVAEGEAEFVDPEEVAVLLFTSGTTSEPKAAVLRHRHLVSYIISSVEFMGCTTEEAQLVSVPPYHIAGISAVLSSLYAGRRLVYLPAFEPEAWVGLARDERITHAMVVPTMLGRILDAIGGEPDALSALRHLSYGGGRMPLELVERTMQVLPGVDLVNAYGLTETSSTIAVLTPGDHREAFASDDPLVRARLGSVGRPLPALEIQVRDADGAEVAPGQSGEIWVRGEQVAGEYLGKSTLDGEGWFPTRDLGRLDDAGFLFLDGRLDDVIVRGAENISPGEIEDVLRSHPAIADAAVFGIPDPEWGEAVAAVVTVGPNASVSAPDLQAWVRERLRSTKTPSRVEFRDELPYTPTGKLLRRVLREELSAESR